MQIFKLTPKPQSDYRLEVNEIKKQCKVEKYGYRHNKIVYGFCEDLLDIAKLQSLGLNIEEIVFDEIQLNLTNNLVERGRAKSKIEHLRNEQLENGTKDEKEDAIAQKNLTDLNNDIQAGKDTLGITGTLKILKF